METFTIFKNDKGIGIRFDTQAIPTGSWVLAFGTESSVTTCTETREKDDEIFFSCLAFGQATLAGDDNAQFAPGI
jgi:hypothetical protein